MPPALSDDDGSISGEEIPFHTKPKPEAELEDQNGEEDDGENGEEDDAEFIVEDILAHAFDKGILKYEVKWLGYEKKSDRTWEPEENLSGATDLLAEYHKKIGGKPMISDASSTSKKRKQSNTLTVNQARKRGANKDDADTPTTKRKIKGAAPAWEPPTGLWEEDVVSVESVEQVPDPKTGELVLMGYVVWKDDRKTQHGLQHLYKKCPQKMLQYYERHLVFKNLQEEENVEEDGDDMKVDA